MEPEPQLSPFFDDKPLAEPLRQEPEMDNSALRGKRDKAPPPFLPFGPKKWSYVDWALGNQSCTPPHSPSAGFRRAGGGAGGEGGAQWRTYTHARVGALFTMVTQERIIV